MPDSGEHVRAEFRAAIDALLAATGRLRNDRSPEAYLQWHQAVDAVKALHEPVVTRALDRARRSRL